MCSDDVNHLEYKASWHQRVHFQYSIHAPSWIFAARFLPTVGPAHYLTQAFPSLPVDFPWLRVSAWRALDFLSLLFFHFKNKLTVKDDAQSKETPEHKCAWVKGYTQYNKTLEYMCAGWKVMLRGIKLQNARCVGWKVMLKITIPQNTGVLGERSCSISWNSIK